MTATPASPQAPTGLRPVRPLDPAPGRHTLTLRAFAYWVAQYRRTWRGTAITTVLEPLGFLAAMGLGLALLVDEGSGSSALSGVGYLDFVAPGLLAASAMQMAAYESTYPVMGAIRWQKQYVGMLASPLRVTDVLAGHLLFVTLRLTITSAVYLAIMAAFGAVGSTGVWMSLLLLPVGVLTGLAHAPAIFAFAAWIEDTSGFAMLFRFGIIPMFLFSGTFFPIEQLPDAFESVAWVVPLWHGVDLARDLALGTGSAWSSVAHVAYLALWVVVGYRLARRSFARALVT